MSVINTITYNDINYDINTNTYKQYYCHDNGNISTSNTVSIPHGWSGTAGVKIATVTLSKGTYIVTGFTNFTSTGTSSINKQFWMSITTGSNNHIEAESGNYAERIDNLKGYKSHTTSRIITISADDTPVYLILGKVATTTDTWSCRRAYLEAYRLSDS